MANARALGIEPALTGPATRGDAGTVARHLAALGGRRPAALDVYRALLRRASRSRGSPGRPVTGSVRTAPDRTCRPTLTRYDADMQHSIAATPRGLAGARSSTRGPGP